MNNKRLIKKSVLELTAEETAAWDTTLARRIQAQMDARAKYLAEMAVIDRDFRQAMADAGLWQETDDDE